MDSLLCLCYFRINTPRKQGGLGPMKIPLLSDLTHQISKDYGVFLEDQGHTLRYWIQKMFCRMQLAGRFCVGRCSGQACKITFHFFLLCFRGLFIIDDKGVLRQITMNDLPVGRSVDETLRLVQAFQYTDKHGEGMELIWHSS